MNDLFFFDHHYYHIQYKVSSTFLLIPFSTVNYFVFIRFFLYSISTWIHVFAHSFSNSHTFYFPSFILTFNVNSSQYHHSYFVCCISLTLYFLMYFFLFIFNINLNQCFSLFMFRQSSVFDSLSFIFIFNIKSKKKVLLVYFRLVN